MDVGDDDDPAFDGAHGCRAALGVHVGVFGGVGAGGGGFVDVHCVGHDCGIGVRVLGGECGGVVLLKLRGWRWS